MKPYASSAMFYSYFDSYNENNDVRRSKHNHIVVIKQVCLISSAYTPDAGGIFPPSLHTGKQEQHKLTRASCLCMH